MTAARRRLLVEALLALALLAAGAGLRVRDLDRFIASDEVRWTCRSVNFVAALRAGDPAGTFQVGHPGVLTMWLGGLALPRGGRVGRWWDLCQTTDGGSDLSDLDNVGNEGVLQTITPLLFAGRRGTALGGILLLAAVYLALRLGAGVGAPAALTGLGLLVFDPFLLAHSRVLHLDALVALASLLAVVLLAGIDPGRPGRRYVVAALVAGGAAGLALVEKSSALVLVPYAAVVLAAWVVLERGPRALAAAVRRAAAAYGAWLAGAAAGAALAWPALLTGPLTTLRQVAAKALEEGGRVHASGNYFLGRPVDDPGPLFYPVAGALRLTPVTTVAAIAALLVAGAWGVWAWRRRPGGADGPGEAEVAQAQGWRSSPEARTAAVLVGWAVAFALALTLGPKKFDRYLLPALVALTLAGGVGLAVLSAAYARRRAGGLLAVAVVLQALAAWRSQPYPMAYYNPLLGGIRVAERAILVGWGEGYDLAAAWLNAQPDPDKLEASTPGVANFAPLFLGRTRSEPGYRPGRTDYAVTYISKVQRGEDDQLPAGVSTEEPLFVGRIAGLPYVWIYDNPTVAPLEAALAARVGPKDVIVADGESVFARRYQGSAPLVRVWGHWGEDDVRQALAEGLPPDWRHVWVVRYPDHDPDADVRVLTADVGAGRTTQLLAGVIELTRFDNPAAP